MRTLRLARVLGAGLLFGALLGPIPGEIFYPWRDAYIGALDGGAWPGLVLVPNRDSAFAFKLRVTKDGQTAESEDFFYLVSEVGPQAPDGQYARVRFDLGLPFGQKGDTPILLKPAAKSRTLTLEWSRRDEETVIGRILAPSGLRLEIVHYWPWDNQGSYERLADGHVRGESGGRRKAYYYFWLNREAEEAPAAGPGLVLPVATDEGRDLYFACGIGDTEATARGHLYRFRSRAAIDDVLEEEAEAYENKRVQVRGLYEGSGEALANNLFWTVLYQPGQHRLYTPAGRRWIFARPDGTPDHWQIFEWDSFFNALELGVESSKHAMDAVTAVLQTQYANGNIPNWRSRFGGTPDRSQPPVGSYVILKLFQRLGDLDFLRSAYPTLEKWHAFWTSPKAGGRARRDGNGDGLLEWGSDIELLPAAVPSWEKDATLRQRAAWESGQDDLPNWDEAGANDETGTLTMNCLDLTSLYALDAWCLGQIAALLDRDADAKRYAEEYARLRSLINANLWNEKEGFYFDRHWDGRFSTHKAASNFYPLLAGIPDDRQARRIVQHLLNPAEFWGDYVIPTISRDDPAFKPTDQQYWRGTIWPPTNYLVYQGLKAYGFDAVAGEFARRSVNLFLRAWEAFQLCPENFDSLTGEAGGQRYQSWGPLFVLVGLEEYIDFTPWEGFRFGMLRPEDSGRLARVAIQGRHYEVEVSESETILREEGETLLEANRAAVFRQFLYGEREVSFRVKTLDPLRVSVELPKKGKYQVLLDGGELEVFSGRTAKVRVPEGDHTVVIQLLESLEKQ